MHAFHGVGRGDHVEDDFLVVLGDGLRLGGRAGGQAHELHLGAALEGRLLVERAEEPDRRADDGVGLRDLAADECGRDLDVGELRGGVGRAAADGGGAEEGDLPILDGRAAVGVERIDGGLLALRDGDVRRAAGAGRVVEVDDLDRFVKAFLALDEDLHVQRTTLHQRCAQRFDGDLEGQFIHHGNGDLVGPRLVIHAVVAVLHEVVVLPNAALDGHLRVRRCANGEVGELARDGGVSPRLEDDRPGGLVLGNRDGLHRDAGGEAFHRED